MIDQACAVIDRARAVTVTVDRSACAVTEQQQLSQLRTSDTFAVKMAKSGTIY